MDEKLTLKRILELYEKGTITILTGGKLYFSKEKEVVRRQPNNSRALKNNNEVIIPVFF